MALASNAVDKKSKINRYYASRVYADREGYEILSWSSREVQMLRFKVLLDIMRRHFCETACPRLLDVGCGLGELASFLEKAGFPVKYTGVDITEEVLAEGRRRHAELDLRLLDVFQKKCPFGEQSFDVVYASGIFNMELGNNEAFAHTALRRFQYLSSKLVVANFLHARSSFQPRICHYYLPERLLEALDEDKYVAQTHEDYLDNDFTLELLRLGGGHEGTRRGTKAH